MPTEDAYSSRHLVLSNLGVTYVLLLRPLTLNHTSDHLFMTVALIWLLTEFDFFLWFDTNNAWPFPWVDLLLNLTLVNIGFHGTCVTDVACRQETLTPPDIWSCPTLGLASVLRCRDQSLLNLSCLRTVEFRTSLGTSVFAPSSGQLSVNNMLSPHLCN